MASRKKNSLTNNSTGHSNADQLHISQGITASDGRIPAFVSDLPPLSTPPDHTDAAQQHVSQGVEASDGRIPTFVSDPPSSSTTPTVTTDQEDYAPGSTATLTASGFAAGSTLQFEVQHATDAGADGVWGTPDDVLDTDTGAGHEPWSVTDGSAGDLDGQANGSVTTSWHVNPDDSAGATFLLTATSAGRDGVLGSEDDAVATTSFTDSAPGIVATGVNVTLDETAGLQNGTATPSPAEDANDNDILLASLPSTFSARLSALNAGTASGAALSGYTGAAGNTGSNAFTITPAPGAVVTDVSFVGSGGAPLNGTASGLFTLDGTEILLYTDSNNNILLGRAGGSTGAIVFAAYIEETGGTPPTGGKIWTVEYQPLQHPDSSNPDDALDLDGLVYIGTSQNLEFSLANAPSGQNLFLMFTTATPTTYTDANNVVRISDATIIATGKDPADQSTGANITTGDTINTSQAGGPTTFGTNNQMIVEQEGIRFTFVTGARQNVTIPNLDQNEADLESNIDFTGMFNARMADFDVVQLQSGKSAVVRISAFSTAVESGNAFIDGYTGDTPIAISNVKIINISTGQVIEDSDGSVNDPAIAISFSGGVATITGVKAGYRIEYTTSADHNRVLVENGAAVDAKGNNHADFDIGGFTLRQVSSATAEIGSKMIFEDDGPTAQITRTTGNAVLDESLGLDANDANAEDDDVPPGTDPFTGAYGTPIGAVAAVDLADTTTSTGEDDEGATTAVTLSIVNGDGSDSGLVTTDGTQINLWKEANGDVTGRAGDASATVIFAIRIDNDGKVSVAQYDSLEHPTFPNNYDEELDLAGKLDAVVTVTDGDGDVATHNVGIGDGINFQDDGPTASAALDAGSVIHDETPGKDLDANDIVSGDTGYAAVVALFSGVTNASTDMTAGYAQGTASVVDDSGTVFGQDEEGADTSYSLDIADENGTDSGLTTTDDVKIFLFKEGDLVVGRIGADALAASTGAAAFAVAIDADSGVLSLAQYAPIKHDNNNDPDDSKSIADGALFATVTATDGDDDVDTDSVDIGARVTFQDDGPDLELPGALPEPMVLDESRPVGTDTDGDSDPAGLASVTANLSGLFDTNPDFGADGAGGVNVSYELLLTGTNVASGLYALESTDTTTGDGDPIGRGAQIVLNKNASGQIVGSVAGTTYFTISVDNNPASLTFGHVTFAQALNVWHGDTSNADDTSALNLAEANWLQLQQTVSDAEGDQAQETLNLGQNAFEIEDDGPTLAFGNLVGTGTDLPQFGFWSKDAGTDGPNVDDLQIALTGFQLGGVDQAAGSFSLTEGTPSPDGSGNYTWTGSLSGDFNNDGMVDATPLTFTLTARSDGKYVLDLAAPVQSTTTTDTADGGLGAGGPDAVQTLFIPEPPATPKETVVFFSAKINASAADIATGIIQGATDPTEAQLEGLNPPATLASFIDPRSMNVSTAGIGVDNNNMNGYGASGDSAIIDDPAGNTPSDDSMVINPGTLVDKVRVYIDNSVTGYDYAGGERLQYRVFYENGTWSDYTTVVGDLGKGNAPKFFEIDGAGQKIDAVQLTMLYGEIKIPNIQFVTVTESVAKDISLDFTASLTDADGDTVSSDFSADLFTNEAAGATYDYELIGTALVAEAFDVDLASTRNDYLISGFDASQSLRDTLVLIGDPSLDQNDFQINNSGANSIVTVTESGGQTTTITVVGVDLLSTDIVFGA